MKPVKPEKGPVSMPYYSRQLCLFYGAVLKDKSICVYHINLDPSIYLITLVQDAYVTLGSELNFARLVLSQLSRLFDYTNIIQSLAIDICLHVLEEVKNIDLETRGPTQICTLDETGAKIISSDNVKTDYEKLINEFSKKLVTHLTKMSKKGNSEKIFTV